MHVAATSVHAYVRSPNNALISTSQIFNRQSEETVLLKIDDVRLLESRKSARLVNSDTDFSKLADVAINASSSSTAASTDGIAAAGRSSSRAIEVPGRSDYVQIAGSRKRRTSENVGDDEAVLSECSAAMLLMKLSCSPHAAALHHSLPAYSDLPSPAGSHDSRDTANGSSSGYGRSATPSPPLSSSTTDEGIVKDLNSKLKKVGFLSL